jgi:putative phosphoesterase
MLTILGDTHGDADARLDGRTLTAVQSADHVIHTGDFTTERVYEAIADRAGADHGGAPLSAVHGNRDRKGLQEGLPGTLTVEYEGYRFVVVHGHEHDRTALGLLARQEDADVVVVGHSHRPGVEETPHCLVVNPGSHADPRGATPAHAEVEQGERGMAIELWTPDGTLVTERSLSERDE